MLAATNDFPEFTGRLCPAPCEAACVLAIDQARGHHRADREGDRRSARSPRAGSVRGPRRRTRQARRGRRLRPGGARRRRAAQPRRPHGDGVRARRPRRAACSATASPTSSWRSRVVDRRLSCSRPRASTFRCGRGRRARRRARPAARRARRAGARASAPGGRAISTSRAASSPGVVLAMDYLERAEPRVGGAPLPPDPRRTGKRVVILGGGDTGSDCLGTAHRQGAAHVEQIELMPAPPPGRAPENPWPEWPIVFRTSSSQEEGGGRAVRPLHHPAHRPEWLARGDGAGSRPDGEGRGRTRPRRPRRGLGVHPAGGPARPGDGVPRSRDGGAGVAARPRPRRPGQRPRRRAVPHLAGRGLGGGRRAAGSEPHRLGDRPTGARRRATSTRC